ALWAVIAIERVARTDVKVMGSCSPYVVGIVKPRIAMPEVWLETLTEDEISAVMAHETAHINAKHIWGRVGAELASSWMWFSPASWMLSRKVAEVQEIAADADAIESGAERRDLASALVKLAEASITRTPRLSQGAVTPGKLIEQRLKRLLEDKPMKEKLNKTVVVSVITGATVMASMGVMAMSGTVGDA